MTTTFGLDDFAAEEVARARFLAESDREYMSSLRKIREDSGLSQEQVGELLGKSKQAIQKLESPDANPTLSTLRQYALAIGALVRHHVERDHGQLVNNRPSQQGVRFGLTLTPNEPSRKPFHVVELPTKASSYA